MIEVKTKKILCIVQLPPPLHGASLMNSYVVNSQILRKNFYINYINLQFAASIKELKKFSILKVFKAFYFGFEIIKRVIIYRPDLVYFTLAPEGYAFFRDAFYVFLLKLMNRKIVFHLHGKGIKANAKESFFKTLLYTWVFKNTNIICLSIKLAEDISDVYKNKPFIVPNGIEIQPKFDRSSTPSKEAVPHILYLSNYIRNKGLLVLIDALSILHNQGYQFHARFVGAPADLTIELLENIIFNHNLRDNVKIIGPRYGNEKNIELQKADIFVFPTYNDAFPLVCLESMQFSLPVVSTFEGSIPDIVIDNDTGFLVETQNAQMLAEKIAVLLKNERLRLEMGKKGYNRFTNNYTLNHFENNIKVTFQSILER